MLIAIAVITDIAPISISDMAPTPPPLPREWRNKTNPRMKNPTPNAETSFRGTRCVDIGIELAKSFNQSQMQCVDVASRTSGFLS